MILKTFCIIMGVSLFSKEIEKERERINNKDFKINFFKEHLKEDFLKLFMKGDKSEEAN